MSEPFLLTESYSERPIRFLELWTHGDWRIKVYGIAYRKEEPQPALVAAAKEVARGRLPHPARAPGRYGVGFLGVHEGRGGNLVFVDWWADENELHHHAYASTPANPAALEYVTPTGRAACVWDLAVIQFERWAWLDAVLKNPAGPDLDRYLAHRLEGSV